VWRRWKRVIVTVRDVLDVEVLEFIFAIDDVGTQVEGIALMVELTA
jgi:hypothetical protein